VALACGILARAGRAEALLEGLAPVACGEARAALAAFRAEGPAGRQALLAAEFSLRPDATARLRAVLAWTPPALARAAGRHLPPYLRAAAPRDGEDGPGGASLVSLLAARLVRETSR
jgi:hypothetical protein